MHTLTHARMHTHTHTCQLMLSPPLSLPLSLSLPLPLPLSLSLSLSLSPPPVTHSIQSAYKLSLKTNSRPVIGHTVSSGLRLTGSKHEGMGFCSLGGLISAAQVYHNFTIKEREGEIEKERRGKREDGILLLIRRKSLHYHFAKFDLFLN